MNDRYCVEMRDMGPNPYITRIEQMAVQNSNFRTAIWTGCYLQMTLMNIQPCGEIGLEVHRDTDQLLRVERGMAVVQMGKCAEKMEWQQHLCMGDAIFIPAGTWHNVLNVGRNALKISSVYAPPHHARGTVHRTKADAESEE